MIFLLLSRNILVIFVFKHNMCSFLIPCWYENCLKIYYASDGFQWENEKTEAENSWF